VYYCQIDNDCKRLDNTANLLNNGIVKDKYNRIFVCNFLIKANTIEKRISVYQLNDDKTLKFLNYINLPINPDNIFYDSDGDFFLTAGYNRGLEYLKIIFNIKKNKSYSLI